MLSCGWSRFRGFLVNRILGLHDTPHRIAWGVALGTFVCFTPTIGIQILLYVAFATLLRANPVSGMPVLFLSNPFTAIPLYYSEWWVGNRILNGQSAKNGEKLQEAVRKLQDQDVASTLWSIDYWTDLTLSIVDLGAEIWLGSLVYGVAAALPIYFVAKWSVVAYRARRSENAETSQERQSNEQSMKG